MCLALKTPRGYFRRNAAPEILTKQSLARGGSLEGSPPPRALWDVQLMPTGNGPLLSVLCSLPCPPGTLWALVYS